MTAPDEWQRVCILCAPRGRVKRLESGHCCVECASWLTTQVADIARLAADAAAWVTPGSSAGGGSRPVPGSRPPLNVDAVDPELTHIGPLPSPTVLEVCEAWERMIRDVRGMAPYGPASAARARGGLYEGTSATLVASVSFLGRQVPWMIDAEFPLEDFADEMRACVRVLRRFDLDAEDRGWGLPCPTETDRGSCGYWIKWMPGSQSASCPRCDREWDVEWLVRVADDVWLDSDTIAHLTTIPRRTIQDWGRHGKVAKRGLLYRLADVRDVSSMRRRNVRRVSG